MFNWRTDDDILLPPIDTMYFPPGIYSNHPRRLLFLFRVWLSMKTETPAKFRQCKANSITAASWLSWVVGETSENKIYQHFVVLEWNIIFVYQVSLLSDMCTSVVIFWRFLMLIYRNITLPISLIFPEQCNAAFYISSSAGTYDCQDGTHPESTFYRRTATIYQDSGCDWYITTWFNNFIEVIMVIIRGFSDVGIFGVDIVDWYFFFYYIIYLSYLYYGSNILYYLGIMSAELTFTLYLLPSYRFFISLNFQLWSRVQWSNFLICLDLMFRCLHQEASCLALRAVHGHWSKINRRLFYNVPICRLLSNFRFCTPKFHHWPSV